MAPATPKNWFKKENDGRIACLLCPRKCLLAAGQRGYCSVRQADGERIRLTIYGRTTGAAVDPIEKKPLYHFFPASTVLSFGTTGCNLGCKFCQNWHISKCREEERNALSRTPEEIAVSARRSAALGVAFTYNDPVIFAEYALDTADACHAAGLKTVAVTAGYISENARAEFFRKMDAANIDLKGFTEKFYRDYCQAELAPVLETLKYVAHHTSTWLELTTLLIPGANDSPEEIDAMTQWISKELGTRVPLHFSAFHPDYRVLDRSVTPIEKLREARKIANRNGLQFVYVGNVRDSDGATTFCPECHADLIHRDGYEVKMANLTGNKCSVCNETVEGHFGPG